MRGDLGMNAGGRRALASALPVLACLLASAPAPADEPPADPDLSTEGMRRLGPIHVRPFLALKDVGYDDNVRFESQEPRSDFTATAGPGLGALLRTGNRGGIYLFQEYDYVAFRDETELNHWNSDARAKGIFLTKNLVLSLEDRFGSFRERPNSEIDLRVRRQNNAVTAGVRSMSKGRLGFRSYARHERIDYMSDDPAAAGVGDSLNRDENTLSLAGELRVLPKTRFILEGAVERIEFDDASQGRDSRTRSILPGFRFDPSASVQGELKLGVTSLDAPDRPQSNVRATTGEGSLSSRVGHFARLKGTFLRDLTFSTLAENLYYVSTRWSAAWQQFFSRRLSSELLYGNGLNHYPEEVTRAGPPPFQGIRDDHFTEYQLTIRYRINDQLSLSARAQRQERDSTDDFFDRDRNFYAIGSEYSF